MPFIPFRVVRNSGDATVWFNTDHVAAISPHSENLCHLHLRFPWFNKDLQKEESTVLIRGASDDMAEWANDRDPNFGIADALHRIRRMLKDE